MLVTKSAGMSFPKKTVSTEDIQEEWMEVKAAQRDPANFRPLYNRYFDPIFRFIFRRTGDEDLTADLCSQAFLKATQHLNDYRFKGVPFSAWLYRIASNEVSQYYRTYQKNRMVSMEEMHLHDMIDEMEREENEELRNGLILALDKLKEPDLQLIEMRFFEQRPFKEIADIVGMTESNVKVKTYRILERLKKTLTQ
jgi:RNA polymerase sigma-70 factor, ECF subfamily